MLDRRRTCNGLDVRVMNAAASQNFHGRHALGCRMLGHRIAVPPGFGGQSARRFESLVIVGARQFQEAS